MTSVTVTIGASTVSNAVKSMRVWDEASAGVGRCEIVLDNQGGTYNGTFSVNDVVDIDISGADIMNGWLDMAHKEVDDQQDVFRQVMRAMGRNYGRELVDLTADLYKEYQAADDTVENLLTAAGTNITYTSPSAGTSMSYDSKNAYLLDSLKEIAQRDDADFYVSTATTLQYFGIGTQDSTITLQALAAGGTSNNILDFEWDEEEGTDLKNYIIVRGKKVDDGWTEFNKGDFVYPASGTPTDETTIVNRGVGSIKYTKGAASASWLELDFTNASASSWNSQSSTLYGRDELDWSGLKSGDLSFAIYYTTRFDHVFVQLEDENGDKIIWYNAYPTWSLSTWHSVGAIKIGSDVKIVHQSNLASKQWHYAVGDSSFNWVIKKIKIGVADNTSLGGGGDFYLDGLKLPNYMIAVKQDATSQASYGVRQLVIDKQNVESQIELEAIAADTLAKRKDVIKTLSLVAAGSAGISTASANLWLPGYYVAVNIPDEGINNDDYRMLAIEHVYDTENFYKGHDYYVKLTLVPKTTVLDMARWRALKDKASIIKELRNQLAVLQQQEEHDIDRYPALPAPLDEYIIPSNFNWWEYWQADQAPITLKTGTSTVTDANAVENVAIWREAADASADMWDSDDIWPPGPDDGMGGVYYFYFRMKVTANASTDTILTLAIYNVTGAANLSTLDISPSMFTAGGAYDVISLKAALNPGYPIKIRGDSFITGITDLYFDWVGVSTYPVPFVSQTTSLSSHTGTDVDSHSGTDTDAHGGTDADAHSGASNVSAGSHLHNLTYIQGYLVTGWVTRYCASASGGPVTTAFSAPTGSTLDNWVYGTAVASGGSHNHTQNQSSNHSVTQPNAHSVTDPDDHTVTDPSTHVVTNPEHRH